MDRRNYYYKKRIQTAEMEDLQDNIENADKNIIKNILGHGIWSGLYVTKKNPGTSDAIFVVSAGIAYDQNGNRIEIGANQDVDLAGYLPTAGLIKSLAITVRFARSQSQQELDGNNNLQYFQNNEYFIVVVIEGGTDDEDPELAELTTNDVICCDLEIDADINYTILTGRVIRTSATVQQHINNTTNPHSVKMSQLNDNILNSDMDANGNRIIDLPLPTDNSEPVIKENIIFTEVTENTELEPNKKYIVTGDNVEVSLPGANIGDEIDIFSSNASKIIQEDAEHLINFHNQYFTTKGINGFLILPNNSNIELIFKGVDGSIIFPGTKLTSPTGSIRAGQIDCTSDGVYVLGSCPLSPYMFLKKRNGDSFSNLANPSVLPQSTGRSCCVSNDGNYFIIGCDIDTIVLYKRTGDVLNKLADPAIKPGSGINRMMFSYDDRYLTITTNASPFLFIYKRTGDSFSKLADPSTIPSYACNNIHWTMDGNYFTLSSSDGTPRLYIYKRTGDSFAKLTDPSDLPTASAVCLAYSHNGEFLVTGLNASPFLHFYKVNGDTYTPLNNPSSVPTSQVTSIRFSYDDKYLILTCQSSPYIYIYLIDGDFFIKLNDPTVLPDSYPRDIRITNDSKYLILNPLNDTINLNVYKNITNATKTWLVKELSTRYEQEKNCMFK
ncbi:MAG: WD40 repeat domain-containing protein [Spirochaetes bacterium]|nr:WD40 repeat domain-containing protein [Spirochaetota bacterium]